jgi:hypothetical protein
MSEKHLETLETQHRRAAMTYLLGNCSGAGLPFLPTAQGGWECRRRPLLLPLPRRVRWIGATLLTCASTSYHRSGGEGRGGSSASCRCSGGEGGRQAGEGRGGPEAWWRRRKAGRQEAWWRGIKVGSHARARWRCWPSAPWPSWRTPGWHGGARPLELW